MRHYNQQDIQLNLAVINKDEFMQLITDLIRETIRDEVNKIIEEHKVKYLTVKEAAKVLGVSKVT